MPWHWLWPQVYKEVKLWQRLPPAADEAVVLLKAEARQQAKANKLAAAEQRRVAQKQAEDAAADAAAEGASVQGAGPRCVCVCV
jgi:hypothetical protein